MRKLFAFIYHFRAFLIFVLLEVLSVYLIIRNNNYQNAAFYNSANFYAGHVLAFQSNISDYFQLVAVNRELAHENARLKELLFRRMLTAPPDSTVLAEGQALLARRDTASQVQDTVPGAQIVKMVVARVINNSFRKTNNFLTLDAGAADGIEAGMGVVGSNGVVGRVKVVSKHFATVTSLLHSQTQISSKIKRDNTFGTVKWKGPDFTTASLDYIPLHVKLAKGDTVVTSGYNAVFPEGIPIGTIQSFKKEQDKSFYTITIKLAVDFTNLAYVYVIKNQRQTERDSLETITGITNENE